MSTDSRLRHHRTVWESKPVLRALYQDYYRRIITACRPGLTLEVGGGSGNLKAFASHVISTDILPAAWLDAVADAQALPFADRSFENIVMFDVLHHIPCPRLFLTEAERLLKPGGLLIALEPVITPFSRLFYRCCHPEPVRLADDPLARPVPREHQDPYHGNQAIPTLLFVRNRQRLEEEFRSLRVRTVEWLSLFVYPLSGGFRAWSLLPSCVVRPLLRIEEALVPFLGSAMAFRVLVIVQRAE
jgi:SAM-dependent methyltransferase